MWDMVDGQYGVVEGGRNDGGWDEGAWKYVGDVCDNDGVAILCGGMGTIVDV